MILFILGIGIGFSLTIWFLVFDFTYNFDYSVMTNIVIAFSTSVAAAIHFDSVKKQRRDRIWEINRDILLKLSHTISATAEQTSKICDYEFEVMQDIYSENEPIWDDDINKNFRKNMSDTLKVYKPLLSKYLIKSIEKYLNAEANINECYERGEISVFEAYDSLAFLQQTLHEEVSSFIRKISGI